MGGCLDALTLLVCLFSIYVMIGQFSFKWPGSSSHGTVIVVPIPHNINLLLSLPRHFFACVSNSSLEICEKMKL